MKSNIDDAFVVGDLPCIGATITEVASGVLTSIGGWNLAFMFWAISSFASATPLALFGNYQREKKYL